MKQAGRFFAKACLAGLLLLVPAYLSFLLLQKVMRSLASLVRPIATLLPDWLPAETVLSLLLVWLTCFLVGVAVCTRAGQRVLKTAEQSLFERLPGYALFRSLTQQLTGGREEHVWKPAMVVIEDALVPAFIIEEFDDGRFTVFVPSAPTPVSGSVYVLTGDRVHPLDVPLTRAIKTIAQWGSGSKDLVAALGNRERPLIVNPTLQGRAEVANAHQPLSKKASG